MPQTVISAEGLTVYLQNKIILKNVTFEVKGGEYIGIIGPNSAGKSTLLKCLIGVLPVRSGKLSVFGLKPDDPKAQRLIGFVPQLVSQIAINFPISVGEFVRSGILKSQLAAPLWKTSRDEVESALDAVGLKALRADPFYRLSGGLKQRVAIARALVRKPKLLFLDEPLSGVDAPSQADFYKMLDMINKQFGITVILVSHDIEAVTRHANRVLCLNRTLQKDCHPMEIKAHDTSESFFAIHHHHGSH